MVFALFIFSKTLKTYFIISNLSCSILFIIKKIYTTSKILAISLDITIYINQKTGTPITLQYIG